MENEKVKILAIYGNFSDAFWEIKRLNKINAKIEEKGREYLLSGGIRSSDIYYHNRFDRWMVFKDKNGAFGIQPYAVICRTYTLKKAN